MHEGDLDYRTSMRVLFRVGDPWLLGFLRYILMHRDKLDWPAVCVCLGRHDCADTNTHMSSTACGIVCQVHTAVRQERGTFETRGTAKHSTFLLSQALCPVIKSVCVFPDPRLPWTCFWILKRQAQKDKFVLVLVSHTCINSGPCPRLHMTCLHTLDPR